MVTAPSITFKLFGDAGPHRISVNVSDQFQKITIRFNQNGLVPAAKQGPVAFMADIVSLRIYTVDMPHASGKIHFRRFYKNMVMRRHQTKCGDPDAKHIRRFPEQILKIDAVCFIPEEGLPSPGSIHNMIPGIRISDS